jgi:periplasmic protein TonB
VILATSGWRSATTSDTPPWCLGEEGVDRGRSLAFGVSLALHGAVFAAIWLGARLIPLPSPPEVLPVELLHEAASEAAARAPAPQPAVAATPPAPAPKPPERRPLPLPKPARPIPSPRPAPAPSVATSALQPQAPSVPAPAAGPASSDRVYGEGEVDRAAAPEGAIEPLYPSRQRMLGREGTVVLLVTVAADGRARSLEVVTSAGGEFDAAAREAASAARFRPALRAGQPVASTVTLRVRFHLQ